ncbi:MAG: hydroxyacylglutathione hydrolase [Alphaproteobacteria bacterium]
MLQVHQFPCLEDNYGFLAHDPESGETAAVDTPDATRILAEAEAKGWRISQIWNTHWHPDHAGGNAAIKAATSAVVTGPAEIEKIGQAPDRVVTEGDVVALGTLRARVLDVGGHTLGHIAYVFDDARVGFVGDALFSMGCGRLFEGTPEQMWASLSKLAALPSDATLYCAHEYTAGNAKFALSVDADNADLQAREAEVTKLRAANQPTVPMRLAIELRTNPFLRAPQILPHLAPAEAFGELRRRKDNFK